MPESKVSQSLTLSLSHTQHTFLSFALFSLSLSLYLPFLSLTHTHPSHSCLTLPSYLFRQQSFSEHRDVEAVLALVVLVLDWIRRNHRGVLRNLDFSILGGSRGRDRDRDGDGGGGGQTLVPLSLGSDTHGACGTVQFYTRILRSLRNMRNVRNVRNTCFSTVMCRYDTVEKQL